MQLKEDMITNSNANFLGGSRGGEAQALVVTIYTRGLLE